MSTLALQRRAVALIQTQRKPPGTEMMRKGACSAEAEQKRWKGVSISSVKLILTSALERSFYKTAKLLLRC